MLVVVLTLDKHRTGNWITELTNRLDDAVVLSVEELMKGPVACDANMMHEWTGLINRVSDAADPVWVKATLSILQTAKLLGIPVFNGPNAYALCTSKWCHHVIFDKAGVSTPRTFRTLASNASTTQKEVDLPFPYLIKPNAGGFGAGIRRIESGTELPNVTQLDTSATDPVVVLQPFYSTEWIYRVWFLGNKVQCAVRRRVTDSTESFTTGCSAKSCKREIMEAWKVPDEVAREIERIAGAIDDMDAGSVELLIHNGKRLYFDLNLLSTLPDVMRVSNRQGTWKNSFNPWAEFLSSVSLTLQTRSS